MTYKVGDDSTIAFPVTDSAVPPGDLNFTPIVRAWLADGTTVEISGASWKGSPGATRDLEVPLSALAAGLWGLGLVITGGQDLFLGNVLMGDGSSTGGDGGAPVPGGPGVSEDLGEVGSTVTISQAGSYELDLTGDLAITVTALGDVTIWVHGEGAVTVAGETFEVDGDEIILVVRSPRGVQTAIIVGAAAGEGPVEDSTPPSAITDLAAVGAAGEIVLTWSAATDAESSVGYRYRAWLTSGGASGAWTTTASTGATITGLAAGAYTVEAYSYSAGGSTTADTATATVTAPITYDIGDDFNTSNTSNINGRNTPVGAKTWVTPWEAGLGSNEVNINGNRTGPIGGGAARVLPTSQNYRVTATYDVTASSAQVRLYARADPTSATADGTASVCAIVRVTGTVSAERGNDYSIGDLATGQPLTGTIALEVNGGTGRVLIDGAQVGATFSVSSVVGTHCGFGLYSGGRLDNFEVDYL